MTQGQTTVSGYVLAGTELKERLDSNLIVQSNTIKKRWFEQLLKKREINFWFMRSLHRKVSDYTDAYMSAVNELKFYKMKPIVTDNTTADIIKADSLYFNVPGGEDSIKYIAVSLTGRDVLVDTSNLFIIVMLIIILIGAVLIGFNFGRFYYITTGFLTALLGLAVYILIDLSWPYRGAYLLVISVILGITFSFIVGTILPHRFYKR
jgi:hypothetical protein